MADVIDFKDQSLDKPKEEIIMDEDYVLCKTVLDDLNKELKNLKDLFIFYIDKDNNISVIETDVRFPHKAVMLQLLQHNINRTLDDSYEDEEDLIPTT